MHVLPDMVVDSRLMSQFTETCTCTWKPLVKCTVYMYLFCDCCCHSSLFEWVKEREQKKEDIAQVRMDIFRKRLLKFAVTPNSVYTSTSTCTCACTCRDIPSETMYITRLIVTILVVGIIAKLK